MPPTTRPEGSDLNADTNLNNTNVYINPSTSPAESYSSARKRRISSAAASRGVANLTPEQLAKKRANDREAQRAIRERTKSQIESLERRIQELTSRQPYQELQNVIRQKEALEAENGEIKKRLTSVLDIIQPLLNGQVPGDNNQAQCDSKSQPQPASTPASQTSIYNGVSNATSSTPYSQSPSIPGIPVPLPHSSAVSQATSAPNFWQPPQITARTHSYTEGFSPVNAANRRIETINRGLDSSLSREKLGFGFLLGGRQQLSDERLPANSRDGPGLPADSHITLSHPRGPSSFPNEHGHGVRIPVQGYATPLKNLPPTCPLDGLLLDFLAERRARAAEGASKEILLGPVYPSWPSLLNAQRSIYSHPVSKVFTDMLVAFPDLCNLPEKVAVLYVMFYIMRWQIAPTQENYDRLPTWVTPCPSQLHTPHPAWVDHLPWPRMREIIIQDHQNYPFDNFFVPYTKTLSLNWPYDPADTLLPASGAGLTSATDEELVINPAFERHLRDLHNWSLGPAFAKTWPTLAPTTRIAEVKKGAP